jgi:hypothetical protein
MTSRFDLKRCGRREVLLAVGVLLTDYVLALAGLVVGALGVVAVIGFGSLVAKAVKSLF